MQKLSLCLPASKQIVNKLYIYCIVMVNIKYVNLECVLVLKHYSHIKHVINI